MPRQKSLNWENSELYLRLSHHDERRDSVAGYCHEIRVDAVGTTLELHDESRGATPRCRDDGEGLPTRTRLTSGLTRTTLPLASFESWWRWFRSSHDRPFVLVIRSDVYETVEEHLGWWIDEAATVHTE